MSTGTGGLPGLPEVKMAGTQNVATDVSAKNIFDLIKQGTSQSMTSALPYVQSQFAAKSSAAAPQIAAIKQTGEERAAVAQSDAGSRGLRGSDIEAAGMAGARGDAAKLEAEFRSNLAIQEAQFMAESIMKSYGFDIQQNTQMYNNLAQAIGQELVSQREMEMREKELALAKKQMKANSKNSLISALIGAGGTLGGGYLEGLAKTPTK